MLCGMQQDDDENDISQLAVTSELDNINTRSEYDSDNSAYSIVTLILTLMLESLSDTQCSHCVVPGAQHPRLLSHSLCGFFLVI